MATITTSPANLVTTLIANQTAAIDDTRIQADSFLTSLLQSANVTFDVALPGVYNYAQPPNINFPIYSATRSVLPTPYALLPTAPTNTFTALTDVTAPVLTTPEPVIAFPSAPTINLGTSDPPTAPTNTFTPLVDVVAPVLTTPEPVIAFPSAPVINLGTAAPPTAPTTEFSTITDVTVPDLTAVAPVINIPASPSTTLPSAPAAVSFTSPDIPAAPLVNLPTVPTFAALALPTPPSIDLPSLSSVLPPDDLLIPGVSFQYVEPIYASILLDPLKSKLLYDLQNGGYGIDTTDEIALVNRARDREIEVVLTRIDEVGRTMAARGFPLPPGELTIHIDRAWQDMQNKVSGVSRDIHLERNKLFVENRQFTIREVRETEQIMFTFFNAVQDRSLNAAKATVEMGLAVYDVLAKRYQLRLEAYKAEATVFAERIRGELTKAEIYRTQVDAANVTVQMQNQLVQMYLAQLKGIEVSVDIYKVQMEAANVQAQIERLKLEAFREQVGAYTAQVQAKVAEFGMYRAQIEGNTALVNVYEGQVRAFGSQVQAAKVQSDIRLGRLQSETEQARAKTAQYDGQIRGYEADIRRLIETGRLELDEYKTGVETQKVVADVYDSLVRAFGAKVQASKATSDIQLGRAQAETEQARAKTAQYDGQIRGYEADVRRLVETGRLELEEYKIETETQKTVADVYDSLVRAFGAKVQASKATSDIQLGRAQAETEQARAKTAQFDGQVRLFEADLGAQTKASGLLVDTFRADVEWARGANEAGARRAELQTKAIEASVQENINISRMTIEDHKAQLAALIEGVKLRVGAAEYASEKFYALLTAMQNSLGTLAVQTATA